jgi:hypothetical protein
MRHAMERADDLPKPRADLSRRFGDVFRAPR